MSGEAPEGWTIGPMVQFFELQRGHDLPLQNRGAGGVPVIASNGIVGWHNHSHLSGPGVVTGRSGTIGKVNYIEGPYWPLNTTLYVRDFKGSEPEFVYRFLEHFPLAAFQSGTGVPTLNRNDIHPIDVAFPPLDEQRRIADVLRSVDEAIAVGQDVAEQAQTVWHGLTERLLWDRLSTSPDAARQLGHVLRGTDYGVNAPLGNEPTGYAVLRMGNLQDGWICPTDLKWGEIDDAEAQALALDVGDILFNRTNSRDLVGKVALVREPTDFLYASYIVRLRVNQSVVDPYYLFAVMHSRRAQSQFKSIATPGVSQSNINPTNLKRQVIPLPPLAEQREIAAQLQSVEAARRAALDELTRLRQTKSDLMSDLISGRVRVAA
ncbi:restriction endonuclease subunit S [Mesorhizobium sp.]|uniref:restriction endonuclease subunit S n=1 Tax=Mesorhizobium sp. TaxID=1871066 RepID=UPI000FE8D3E8|nr:restriction endonuclease subunit S [Mesorhizobium sp.]RWA80464.1 MAG: hypothetical protein EOQ30_21885 [Mesorhizobium sp.]